jgi:hypothetical protein
MDDGIALPPNVSGRLAHHAARPLGCQLQLAARSGDKGRSSRPIAGPPKRPETPPALGRRGASLSPARTLPAESDRGRIAARVVRRLIAPSRSVLGGAVRVRKGFGLLHDLASHKTRSFRFGSSDSGYARDRAVAATHRDRRARFPRMLGRALTSRGPSGEIERPQAERELPRGLLCATAVLLLGLRRAGMRVRASAAITRFRRLPVGRA